MPGLKAKELSRRIRNHSPFTKIALMTDNEADDVIELLKDETADYYFPKPLNKKKSVRFSRLKIRSHDPPFSVLEATHWVILCKGGENPLFK
jgi:DNA-binding response OmpR family regulator